MQQNWNEHIAELLDTNQHICIAFFAEYMLATAVPRDIVRPIPWIEKTEIVATAEVDRIWYEIRESYNELKEWED